MKIPIGLAAGVLLALLLACHDDKGDNPTGPTGQKPVITSMGSDASEVLVGGYTSVYCDAYDPDGDSLDYRWSAIYGTFPEGNRGAAVRWVAPASPYTVILTCTVTDYMYSVSMSLGINVVFQP
ncbi:MAG: hypothetical protein PHR28_09255 [candidate division Zixibacteria bacterium]|nr:hypothetical protein [candidate division Zixibacteria bacterium]